MEETYRKVMDFTLIGVGIMAKVGQVGLQEVLDDKSALFETTKGGQFSTNILIYVSHMLLSFFVLHPF